MLSAVQTGEDLLVFARVVQAVLTRKALSVAIGEVLRVFARVVQAVLTREVLTVSTGEVLLVFARVFLVVLTGEVLLVFVRVFLAVLSRDVQRLLVFGVFSSSAAFLFANSASIVFSTEGTPSVRGQARSSFVTSFSLSGSEDDFSAGSKVEVREKLGGHGLMRAHRD